jgi:hypothetical protein
MFYYPVVSVARYNQDMPSPSMDLIYLGLFVFGPTGLFPLPWPCHRTVFSELVVGIHLHM